MIHIIKENVLKKIIKVEKKIIPIIEQAFVNLSEGLAVMPPILRLDIKESNGEVDVKTAYVKGLDSFAIKISPGFFNNPSLGLPSTSGMMILFNTNNGLVRSLLMDNGYLTNIRTAIAGAISAKYFSQKKLSNVGIIGAGQQAELQLKAVMLVRNPKIIRVWSRNIDKTKKFIKRMSKIIKPKIFHAKNIKDLAENSSLIITATPSNKPLILHKWIKPGTHITAMGSDAEHKNELDPKIINKCDIYIADSLRQTLILGELHHAKLSKKSLNSEKFVEIGNVIKNPKLGRFSDKSITICDLTGTGVQDTAIARFAYNLALKKKLGIPL